MARAFSPYIKYWLPVVLWMGLIFWMSTDSLSSEHTSSIIEPALRLLMPDITPEKVDHLHGLIRKAGHAVEYFVLGLLLFRAFRGDSQEWWNWRWVACAIIVLVLYAVSDELHQSFVPTRTASPFDVGIDLSGGILAQLAGTLWSLRRRKNAGR